MDQKQRFVRWQQTARDQLSYAINLTISLSIAALGFEFSQIGTDQLRYAAFWQRISILVSLLLLSMAVVAGVCAIISRLLDFRLSARINRAGISTGGKEALRAWTERLGKFTWAAFWCLIGLFVIAILLLAAVFFGSALETLI